MVAGSLIPIIITYRYWILIPLSFIEGPIVAFATAALAARGYFNVYVAFLFFVVKDVIVDGGYYYAGRFVGAGRVSSRFISSAHVTRNIDRVRAQWEGHALRTMAAGKLCWGLGPALLASGGMIGMSVSTFLTYAAAVAVLQYSVFFVLGYTVGQAFQAVSAFVRTVQIGVAAIVVAALIYGRQRWRTSEERHFG
jgi:membrane protein DedA with SNARE-associated domain